KGWDLHATAGTEVRAVVAGTTSHHTGTDYGKYVTLTSAVDPTKTYQFCHLSAREPAGTVVAGAKIGETGTTGNASADRPHLHFIVRESGTETDPDGKGFTKPTQVIEATGSSANAINYSDPEPCTPCSM
ncbi:MAG: M23 family metallopeptidase, partial [Saprospiraceae bacterium]|nr:M23 family metallopeptidase [Saprospiraceae bacterium]